MISGSCVDFFEVTTLPVSEHDGNRKVRSVDLSNISDYMCADFTVDLSADIEDTGNVV